MHYSIAGNSYREELPMTQDERNTLVLQLLDHVSPLLRKYAAEYRQVLSFDDLYQDASIHIMRLIDAGTPSQELRRYSYNRVRSRIIDKIKYAMRRQAKSLDAPICDQDNIGTLADLLPDPYRVEPLAILIAQERIEAAMRLIPNMRQSHVALQQLAATALASASMGV
jgi:DNA-directed RNA polymerase specialized sigma24 family protein